MLIAEQNMLAETTTVDDLSDSRSLRQNLGDEEDLCAICQSISAQMLLFVTVTFSDRQ